MNRNGVGGVLVLCAPAHTVLSTSRFTLYLSEVLFQSPIPKEFVLGLSSEIHIR